MDAGALGAVIGISVMVGVVVSWKCIDCFKGRKRRKRQLQRNEANRLLTKPKEEARPILLVKRQWKMKDLKLPKSYVLHHLSVRKF